MIHQTTHFTALREKLKPINCLLAKLIYVSLGFLYLLYRVIDIDELIVQIKVRCKMLA